MYDLSLLTLSLSPNLFSDAVHLRWRTKQNLDYCFLMMYAQEKGIYYIQVRIRVLQRGWVVSFVSLSCLLVSILFFF